MPKEVTIILKDDERNYKQKFLIYDEFTLAHEDPLILDCIKQAKMNFSGRPETIQVRCLMTIE